MSDVKSSSGRCSSLFAAVICLGLQKFIVSSTSNPAVTGFKDRFGVFETKPLCIMCSSVRN